MNYRGHFEDKEGNRYYTTSILMAGMSEDYILDTTGKNIVPLTTEIVKIGKDFSIKNEKIYVDRDIDYVKISANGMMRNASGGSRSIKLLYL
ncbi:MAG: hypothetical protein ACI4UX_01370 [Clostridia bacterium]